MENLSPTKLIYIRKKYNLTQTELASLLKLTNQARISEYERGIIVPSKQVQLLYRILNKYGVEMLKQFD